MLNCIITLKSAETIPSTYIGKTVKFNVVDIINPSDTSIKVSNIDLFLESFMSLEKIRLQLI